MGGSSSSATRRTYNTTNLSQQGGGNVAGDNNRVMIQQADALALEKIAEELGSGVEDITAAGTEQTQAVLDAGEGMTRASLDAVTGSTKQAIDAMEAIALDVQQGAESGTQRAMDFAANYTERAQTGTGGAQLRTLQYTAAAVAVGLVGMAWAAKGG